MGIKKSQAVLAASDPTMSGPSTSRAVQALKYSSRIGAYGLAVAAYSLVGFPLPPGTRVWVAGLSLLFGGIGTLASSAIVTLRLRGSFRILELASLLGLGLGLAAVVLAVFILFGGWAGLEKLVVIAYMAIPVLGLAMVLLLLVGVAKRILKGDDSKPEFT